MRVGSLDQNQPHVYLHSDGNVKANDRAYKANLLPELKELEIRRRSDDFFQISGKDHVLENDRYV